MQSDPEQDSRSDVANYNNSKNEKLWQKQVTDIRRRHSTYFILICNAILNR